MMPKTKTEQQETIDELDTAKDKPQVVNNIVIIVASQQQAEDGEEDGKEDGEEDGEEEARYCEAIASFILAIAFASFILATVVDKQSEHNSKYKRSDHKIVAPQ